jgi:hypothetical protein
MEKIVVIAPTYMRKFRKINCKESASQNRNPRFFILADLTLLSVVELSWPKWCCKLYLKGKVHTADSIKKEPRITILPFSMLMARHFVPKE